MSRVFVLSRYHEIMSQEADELLKKALTLPVAERAELAGSLIESLDEAGDESVKAAWDEEIARRMEDLDSGRLNLPPSPKQGADSPQLSNDQVAALLVPGGNRTGGGSGAVSTTAACIPPAVPLE